MSVAISSTAAHRAATTAPQISSPARPTTSVAPAVASGLLADSTNRSRGTPLQALLSQPIRFVKEGGPAINPDEAQRRQILTSKALKFVPRSVTTRKATTKPSIARATASRLSASSLPAATKAETRKLASESPILENGSSGNETPATVNGVARDNNPGATSTEIGSETNAPKDSASELIGREICSPVPGTPRESDGEGKDLGQGSPIGEDTSLPSKAAKRKISETDTHQGPSPRRRKLSADSTSPSDGDELNAGPPVSPSDVHPNANTDPSAVPTKKAKSPDTSPPNGKVKRKLRETEASEVSSPRRRKANDGGKLQGGEDTTNGLTSKPYGGSPPTTGQKRTKMRIKGFRNGSFWCYRNAALQFLAGSDDLRRDLVAHMGSHRNEGLSTRNGSPCPACVLGYILAGHICSSDDPNKINEKVRAEVLVLRKNKVLSSPFNRISTSQEDSGQYLMMLVDKAREKLQRESKSSTPKKEENEIVREDIISKNLYGQTRTVITCKKCKYRSTALHDLPTMTLTPQRPRGGALYLEDSIEHFLDGEAVSDYTCEKCKHKGQVQKRYECAKLPPFLMIDFPRWERATFSRWSNTIRGEKSLKRLRFPEILHLEEDGQPVDYQLRSVIGHSGTTMSHGHYIAYVRVGNDWYMCNDSDVYRVHWNEVATGDDNEYQATMFGYQRLSQPSSRL